MALERAIELFEQQRDSLTGDPTRPPLVFLNTDVIVSYLRGDTPAAELFSAEAQGRVRFAVNPIVLQELLLAADTRGSVEFEQIRDHLHVLPLDHKKALALLPAVRSSRNRLSHPNDVLILSSAAGCDFLVTNDAAFTTFVTNGSLRVVTTEELVRQLRAA